MPDYFNEIVDKLQLEELDNNENLFFIPKYLGVKPSSFLLAITIFVIIVSLTSNATRIIVSLTCCLIPAYFTFIALESHSKEDNIKYLTYWIVFSLIETVSPVIEFIFPSFFYIALRIGIVIALLHPNLNFSVRFYKEFVEPWIKKYEEEIDNGVKKGKEVIENKYKRFSRN